jgi:hypothetical protein
MNERIPLVTMARFAAADLSTRDGVRALASAAGRVDILVTNATMLITPHPAAGVAEVVIDQALTTNINELQPCGTRTAAHRNEPQA